MVEYTDQKRPIRAFSMCFHYISYLALIFVAPYFSDQSWGVAFSCGIIHIFSAGWLFAVFSQINHLNEFSIETDKGETDEKMLKQSWAARQVATSNNFATKSLFWHRTGDTPKCSNWVYMLGCRGNRTDEVQTGCRGNRTDKVQTFQGTQIQLG